MPEQMAGELRMPIIRMIEGSGGGGSVKTIESTGRANLPGGINASSGLWLVCAEHGRGCRWWRWASAPSPVSARRGWRRAIIR